MECFRFSGAAASGHPRGRRRRLRSQRPRRRRRKIHGSARTHGCHTCPHRPWYTAQLPGSFKESLLSIRYDWMRYFEITTHRLPGRPHAALIGRNLSVKVQPWVSKLLFVSSPNFSVCIRQSKADKSQAISPEYQYNKNLTQGLIEPEILGFLIMSTWWWKQSPNQKKAAMTMTDCVHKSSKSYWFVLAHLLMPIYAKSGILEPTSGSRTCEILRM